MTELASLVLFSDNPADTASFYRALGVDLVDEDHGDGLLHYATDLAGVHFAVLDAAIARAGESAFRQAGTSFVGFYVGSLEDSLASVEALAAPVILGHQSREWAAASPVSGLPRRGDRRRGPPRAPARGCR